MTPEKFQRYQELDLTRIPIAVKRLADMETPLSCYLKLANRPWSYLLESVTGGETWGRYSCIGLSSRERIEVIGARITRFECDEVVEIIESTPDECPETDFISPQDPNYVSPLSQ